MKKYLIYCFFLIVIDHYYGCKKNYTHSISDYPEEIIKYNLQKEYDEMKWNYYAILDTLTTSIDTIILENKSYKHINLVKDTLCISLEVYGIGNFVDDSHRRLAFFFRNNLHEKENKSCKCSNFIPEHYEVENDSIQLMMIGTMIIDRKVKETEFVFAMFEQRITNFPNIIRKYKDQLNPWLKIEAQRRGIID